MLKKKFMLYRVDFFASGENICLYDTSPSTMAKIFLDEVNNPAPASNASGSWLTRAVAEAYANGRLKIPKRYLTRIRKAVLQVRLDGAAPKE